MTSVAGCSCPWYMKYIHIESFTLSIHHTEHTEHTFVSVPSVVLPVSCIQLWSLIILHVRVILDEEKSSQAAVRGDCVGVCP